jgi:hypothetical protein
MTLHPRLGKHHYAQWQRFAAAAGIEHVTTPWQQLQTQEALLESFKISASDACCIE